MLSCTGDLSSDFSHLWHVSQKSNMFDNFGHECPNALCVRGTKVLSLRIVLKAHALFLKINIHDMLRIYLNIHFE